MTDAEFNLATADTEALVKKASELEIAGASSSWKDETLREKIREALGVDASEVEVEGAPRESEYFRIITTDFGTIAGVGLVHPKTKHVVHKDAFSSEWMIRDVSTAKDVLNLTPLDRMSVDLDEMDGDELKILMLKLGIRTQKKRMKRDDVVMLIKRELEKLVIEDDDDEDDDEE
ncbi:hypothetical protein GCM10011360_17490 [Primorskyibacter flagellatus]|uniref:Uncharacterized protein n=1 Tax=Primorskyibacter flagellatus TaxID=1387277 RepID=A0A917A650_9RHOB|nr:hypothetical protein [Primorskyibacter flagellatus]GGE29935.1 hypothetical protein GCM10011360_17490 [Primorskyibacter flagellatus]